MTILVTGASGFIGNHLVPSLSASGRSVTPLDIVDVGHPNFCYCDITDAIELFKLSDLNLEAIVHLAAIASPPVAQRDPKLAWHTNVEGMHNVLQLARKARVRKVIFFSSAHVYGISPKYMPTDENHPLALHDTYTTTKIVGEQLCRLFYENYGVPYAVLRLFNAYGPGQSPDYFIGKKISQAKEGLMTIRDASVTKDWVHVRDVVQAVHLALQSDYVGSLNVGTGIETTLGAISQQVADSFGVPVQSEPSDSTGPSRMCCDNSRIKNTLGWLPTVSFRDGLDEIIKIAKDTR